ncbi:MAG: hypothetical protein Q9227_000826 [Pyrenula ochraceoflavens]
MAPNKCLLLLPSPPVPPTASAIEAAYPAITGALKTLSEIPSSKDTVTRLDIAVASPFSSQQSPRSHTFPPAQILLAGVYRHICLTATKLAIDLDLPGGIDARVFLLDRSAAAGSQSVQRKAKQLGPLFDIEALSESSHAYQTIFSVESESGEALLQRLVTLITSTSGRLPSIERLKGGMVFTDNTNDSFSKEQPNDSVRRHHSVAVGGTFDHLHIGHKLLLTATALALEVRSDNGEPLALTIGITGDELLVNKKHAKEVESWDVRQQKTAEFLESIMVLSDILRRDRAEQHIDEPGPNGKRVVADFSSLLRINYVQISDPFGPTITDESISALVVSKETRAGGKAVNDKRAERGWLALEVFEVDVLDESGHAQQDEAPNEINFQSKISSTAIRKRIATALA